MSLPPQAPCILKTIGDLATAIIGAPTIGAMAEVAAIFVKKLLLTSLTEDFLLFFGLSKTSLCFFITHPYRIGFPKTKIVVIFTIITVHMLPRDRVIRDILFGLF